MIIYFIRFEFNVLPFELRNIIIEYLRPKYLDDIKICRNNFFYFKKLKNPCFNVNRYENSNYDNISLEKVLNNEQTETYIFNNLFEFSKIEIDILQHFENIIYRKRLISFYLFLNESSNKLKYYKSFLLYKELVKELIKSNWGLNYQINDIQKYLLHKEYNYNITEYMCKYY